MKITFWRTRNSGWDGTLHGERCDLLILTRRKNGRMGFGRDRVIGVSAMTELIKPKQDETLRSVDSPLNCAVSCVDGELGKVEDLLFDQKWGLFPTFTGNPTTGRRIRISWKYHLRFGIPPRWVLFLESVESQSGEIKNKEKAAHVGAGREDGTGGEGWVGFEAL